MIEFVKIIHLAALMFGASASFGNLYVLWAKGPHDLPAPGFVNRLRLLFRVTALIAIVTLFASGTILLLIKYGVWVEGVAFSAKMVFATLILLIVLFLNLVFPRIAQSGMPPPSYVTVLHFTNAISLLAAMGFAVASFQ